ncbi:hypothetical protein AB4Y87_03600 [Paenarthrobacter sp. RAF54_2]|uniref:hypothetical protein n=1 Tax=Paenarthrobacter sp. RAF54_2 TaxID=3233061 RepID=UPI003F9976D3
MIGMRGLGQRIGAGAVTLVTGILGFLMAQPAFATTPALAEAGSILVGVKHGSAATPVRVDVHMTLHPSEREGKFSLSLLGDPEVPVTPEKAGDLILGFCGAMKDVRLRKAGGSDELRLEPLVAPTGRDYFSGAVGFNISLEDDCKMLIVQNSELSGFLVGTAGASWAVFFEGEALAPTAAIAGAQQRFVFPNITSTFLPRDVLMMDAVAQNSRATLTPKGLPREFVPSVTTPAMPDSGILEWKFPIAAVQDSKSYRITGTDQQENAWAQGQLFLASGLFGIAGGGLIWFFGTFFIGAERDLQTTASSLTAVRTSSPSRLLGRRHRKRVLATIMATFLAGGILVRHSRRRRSAPNKRRPE